MTGEQFDIRPLGSTIKETMTFVIVSFILELRSRELQSGALSEFERERAEGEVFSLEQAKLVKRKTVDPLNASDQDSLSFMPDI